MSKLDTEKAALSFQTVRKLELGKLRTQNVLYHRPAVLTLGKWLYIPGFQRCCGKMRLYQICSLWVVLLVFHVLGPYL